MEYGISMNNPPKKGVMPDEQDQNPPVLLRGYQLNLYKRKTKKRYRLKPPFIL